MGEKISGKLISRTFEVDIKIYFTSDPIESSEIRLGGLNSINAKPL